MKLAFLIMTLMKLNKIDKTKKIAEFLSEKEFNKLYKPLMVSDLSKKNISTILHLQNAKDNLFKSFKQIAFQNLRKDLLNQEIIIDTIIPDRFTNSDFLGKWIEFLKVYDEKLVLPIDKDLFKLYIGVSGSNIIYMDRSEYKKAISIQINKTSTTVNSYFKRFAKSVISFISHSEFGHSINKELESEINSLITKVTTKNYFPLVEFCKLISSYEFESFSHIEKQSFNCLLDVLNCKSTNGQVIANLLNCNYIIIPKNIEIKDFKKIVQTVKQIVDINVYPITKANIIDTVKKEISQNGIDEIITAILENFDLFVQNEEENYYLKNPSSKTMVYIALKELGGVESFHNIEKKIKELFPYANHNESYKNLLFNKELYFNIGKIKLYGIRSLYPIINDSTDVNTDFFISFILKKSNKPLHIRTIYNEVLKFFPQRIHFYFNEGTIRELLRKYKSYENGFYSLKENNFNEFRSYSIPKSSNFKKEVSINLENEDFITQILNKNNLVKDQFEYWVDNKFKMKPKNTELSIVLPEITNNCKTDSNSNEGVEEGEKKIAKHQEIERNSEIIRKVKKERDWICEMCNLKMDNIYKISFIEGHHKVPLSKSGITITNKEDIALLCPNCHTAIHKFMKLYEEINYSELKTKIANHIYPL